MKLIIRMACPNHGRGPGHVALLEAHPDEGEDGGFRVVGRGEGRTPDEARRDLIVNNAIAIAAAEVRS